MEDTRQLASQEEGALGRAPWAFRDVPWQLWVVVALLAAEGLLGNLTGMFSHSLESLWFLANCLFVIGLVRGWHWVFVLFLFEGALHAVVFSAFAPGVALVNLVMVILVASAARYFFPRSGNNSRACDVV